MYMCHRGTSLTVSVKVVRRTIRPICHLKVMEGMGGSTTRQAKTGVAGVAGDNPIMTGKNPVKLLQNGRTMS